MRLKIFTLIAGLILMVTTSAPPNKVEAQIAVQHVLSLVEPQAIGPEERLELYLPSSRLPAPLPANLHPELVISIQAGGAPVCPSQTVQFTVPPTPGLINILNVYRDGDHLMVNGEEVEKLSYCNKKAQRVVLTVGELGPPPSNDGQGPAVPPTDRLGLVNHGRMLGYSIVNLSTHETVASASQGRVIPKLEIHSTASYPE